MEINEKHLEAMAAALKLSKEDLANEELDLSNRIVYTKEDFETYEKNLKDQEYHSGKSAGYEMPLKESKKRISEQYGIDTEGIKSYDELMEKVLESQLSVKDREFKGSAEEKEKTFLEKIERLKKEKKELQKINADKEAEYESKLTEQLKLYEQTAIDRNLSDIANTLPISIPDSIENEGKEAVMSYLKKQRNNFLTLFKARYDFEQKDGNLIIKDGDNIVHDDVLNPQKPEIVALEFAKSNFINLKDNEVINRSDSKKYGNNLAGLKTFEEFDGFMKSQGIDRSRNEYAKYYSEWQKLSK
jgi:membrane-associated HD superfamily phosphohydrolase